MDMRGKLPKELAQLLGIGQEEDESNLVVVGELVGEEIDLNKKSEAFRDQIMRLLEQADILKKEDDAINGRMWHRIEDRIKVPSRINMTLNQRTKQLRMDREDADYLKIKYEEAKVHPEYEEAERSSYSDLFKK
jgi:hypothetical protein